MLIHPPPLFKFSDEDELILPAKSSPPPSQAIGRLVDGKLYYSRSAAKAAMDKLNQSKAES